MKWRDSVLPAGATAGDDEDWRSRHLDIVVWELQDGPQEWAAFFPAAQIVDVGGGVFESPTTTVEFLVLSFARLSQSAKQGFVKPLQLIRPAAAARCLQQAGAVLGDELARQLPADARRLLDGVWRRMSDEQRARATLDSTRRTLSLGSP